MRKKGCHESTSALGYKTGLAATDVAKAMSVKKEREDRKNS